MITIQFACYVKKELMTETEKLKHSNELRKTGNKLIPLKLERPKNIKNDIF